MHGICPELRLITSKAAWSSVLMPVYGIHFTVTHCKFHVTWRLPDIILYRTTSVLGTALCCVMMLQYDTIHNSTLMYSTGTAHSTTAHLERIDCFLWLSVYFYTVWLLWQVAKQWVSKCGVQTLRNPGASSKQARGLWAMPLCGTPSHCCLIRTSPPSRGTGAPKPDRPRRLAASCTFI